MTTVRDSWACPACRRRHVVESPGASGVAKFSASFKVARKSFTEKWSEPTCCGGVGDASKAEIEAKAPAACCDEGLRYAGRVVLCEGQT